MNTPSSRPDEHDRDRTSPATGSEPFHLEDDDEETPAPRLDAPHEDPAAPPSAEPMHLEEEESDPPPPVPESTSPPERLSSTELDVEVVALDDGPGAEVETESEPASPDGGEPTDAHGRETEAGSEEAPGGDTVRMSLADATKAWIEDSPDASEPSSKDAAAPSRTVRLAVLVLALLAVAVVVAFLAFGG